MVVIKLPRKLVNESNKLILVMVQESGRGKMGIALNDSPSSCFVVLIVCGSSTVTLKICLAIIWNGLSHRNIKSVVWPFNYVGS